MEPSCHNSCSAVTDFCCGWDQLVTSVNALVFIARSTGFHDGPILLFNTHTYMSISPSVIPDQNSINFGGWLICIARALFNPLPTDITSKSFSRGI